MEKLGKKDLLKNILLISFLAIISFFISIILFYTLLDNILLWQFEGFLINISLRILLAVAIFQVLWGIIKKKIPRVFIWILGILYTAVLLGTVLFKSPDVRSVNLNPLTLLSDFSFIPFYVIANFLCFVPLGMFVRYIIPNVNRSFLLVGGFLLSLLFEIVQYIFKLGVSDVNDIIMNGLGFAFGVWIMLLLRENKKIKEILNM